MTQSIRVLIAKVGLDGHDRGAKVVARALRDGGMDVIYTGLHRTPEEVVAAAVQEDVDVLGVSILSGAHMTLLPRIIELLRSSDAADVLVVAGGVIPDEDLPALRESGVAEIFLQETPPRALVARVRELVETARSRLRRSRSVGRPAQTSHERPRSRRRSGGARGVDLRVWPPRYDPCLPAPARRPTLAARGRVRVARGARRPRPRESSASRCASAWERSPFYRRKWEAAGVSPTRSARSTTSGGSPSSPRRELRAAQARASAFRRLPLRAGGRGRPHPRHQRHDRPAHGVRDRGGRLEPDRRGARPDPVGHRHPPRRPRADLLVLQPVHGLVGRARGERARRRDDVSLRGRGPGADAAAVQWAREIRPSAFYGTPSYALHFAETARREGLDPRSLGFRILFFSGEPGAGIASTKRLIEEAFGGICVDTGSMAEMTPWMTNAECHRTDGHASLAGSGLHTEVCDPEGRTGGSHMEARGTPVYTHLERTSQPMIRLVSGDRTRWTDEPCPCGRTYPRLPSGIYGRFDDMLVVRGRTSTRAASRTRCAPSRASAASSGSSSPGARRWTSSRARRVHA